MNRDFITFDILGEANMSELANVKLPDITLYDYYRRLLNREILINVDIDEGVVEWTQLILEWNRYDAEHNIPIEERKKIKIWINSNGGDLNAIMHFIQVISLSKTPVMTIGMGKCYSSGGLLLMAGHKGLRYIFSSTHALVHDGSAGCIADTGKLLDNLEYTKKIENETKEYILSHTLITEDLYERNYRKDWWMTSDDIIKYGLADEIITDLSVVY